MKILFVASKYDYGIKTRGYSYEYYNFYDTLLRMGNDCSFFDFPSHISEYGVDKMNALLIENVIDYSPDLVFTILFRDEIKIETLAKISDLKKTITLNWFCDDHWRFDSFSKYYAHSFDWCTTTSKNAMSKYKTIGYNNIIKTQWAANHYLYKKKEIPFRFDTTFIGIPHSKRRMIMTFLQKNNIHIKTFGAGWDINLFYRRFVKLKMLNRSEFENIVNRTRVSFEEMVNIFNESRININLTSSSKNGFEDQIKGRNFEVPACGGFLLTNFADNLEDYFEIGKEIVCFTDKNDLIKKIKYYLINEEERLNIAKRGLEKIISNHTYVQRFVEIFSKIGLN
jgi:spore maturation protein CgeB